jgi:superfamily II RNA helicase
MAVCYVSEIIRNMALKNLMSQEPVEDMKVILRYKDRVPLL